MYEDLKEEQRRWNRKELTVKRVVLTGVFLLLPASVWSEAEGCTSAAGKLRQGDVSGSHVLMLNPDFDNAID